MTPAAEGQNVDKASLPFWKFWEINFHKTPEEKTSFYTHFQEHIGKKFRGSHPPPIRVKIQSKWKNSASQ